MNAIHEYVASHTLSPPCTALLMTLNMSSPPNFSWFESLWHSLAYHFCPLIDKNKLVKAILPKNARQAVVFIECEEVAASLCKVKEMVIAGPLTASFRTVESMPSEIIIVHEDILDNDSSFATFTAICRDDSCGYRALFRREHEIVLVMNAPKAGLNKFVEHLMQIFNHNNHRVHRVLIEDHRCVDCFWRGNIGAKEANLKLEQSGQNLITAIRVAASLWEVNYNHVITFISNKNLTTFSMFRISHVSSLCS